MAKWALQAGCLLLLATVVAGFLAQGPMVAGAGRMQLAGRTRASAALRRANSLSPGRHAPAHARTHLEGLQQGGDSSEGGAEKQQEQKEEQFDKEDAEWKKMLTDSEVELVAAQRAKEVAKQEFLDYEMSVQPEVDAALAVMAEAFDRKTQWGWVPLIDWEESLKKAQAELAKANGKVEAFRRQSIVKIADAEADIKAAQDKQEQGFAKKFAALKGRRAYRDGLARELLPTAQAVLKQAETAYMSKKADVALRILAENEDLFEQIGVYPDSKASAMSLPGRLYDLKKSISTGTPYRSGTLTGTQYIVLGQSMDEATGPVGAPEEMGVDGAQTGALAAGVVGLAAALYFFLTPGAIPELSIPDSSSAPPAPTPAVTAPTKDLTKLINKAETATPAPTAPAPQAAPNSADSEAAAAAVAAAEKQAAEARAAEEKAAADRAASAKADLEKAEAAARAEAVKKEEEALAASKAEADKQAKIQAEQEAALKKEKAEFEARRKVARESYEKAKQEAENEERRAAAKASYERAKQEALAEEAERVQQFERMRKAAKASYDRAKKEETDRLARIESIQAEAKASYEKARKEAESRAQKGVVSSAWSAPQAAKPKSPPVPQVPQPFSDPNAQKGLAAVVGALSLVLVATTLSNSKPKDTDPNAPPAPRAQSPPPARNPPPRPVGTARAGTPPPRPVGTARVASPPPQRLASPPPPMRAGGGMWMRRSAPTPTQSLNYEQVKEAIAQNPQAALERFQAEEQTARAAWEGADDRDEKEKTLKTLRLAERNSMLAGDAVRGIKY